MNIEVDTFLACDIRYFSNLNAVLLAHSAQKLEAKPVTQSHITYISRKNHRPVIVVKNYAEIFDGDAFCHFFHRPDHYNRIEN